MKEWKHKCELRLLTCEPNPLRPDRVTVGYVLRDTNPDAPRVEVRFAKNLSAVRCVYPDADVEAIEGTLRDMESVLRNVTDIEQYLQNLPTDFPADFTLLPGRALLTRSMEEELPLLDQQYLSKLARTPEDREKTTSESEVGRPYIRRKMQEAFAGASVSDFLIADIGVEEFTYSENRLKLDFGYLRKDGQYRVLHAASVVAGLAETAILALEWPSIRDGMQRRQPHPCQLIAITEAAQYTQSEQARSAQEWLGRAGIGVQPISDIGALAQEIRREFLV